MRKLLSRSLSKSACPLNLFYNLVNCLPNVFRVVAFFSRNPIGVAQMLA